MIVFNDLNKPQARFFDLFFVIDMRETTCMTFLPFV